jgi:hypothetical protein
LESGFWPVSFSQTSLPLTSDIQEVLATANDLFLSFGDWIAVTSTPRRGDPPVLPDLDCGTSSPSHSGAGSEWEEEMHPLWNSLADYECQLHEVTVPTCQGWEIK